MTRPKFSCTIDGVDCGTEHLGQIQRQRDVHTLHEMKRLGAAVNHEGKTLSHDDINLLQPEDARSVNLRTRSSLGPDGARALFKEQMRASDQMWKDVLAKSDAMDDAAPQLAQVDVSMSGIRLEQLRGALNPSEMHVHVLHLHPDHFFAYQQGTTLHAMEVFGMYGGPTELHCKVEKDLVLPHVERLPDYPMLFAASTKLASDGTDVPIYAYHQLKPTEDGISIRVCCSFPPATPKAVVDGHKYHMAIEWWQLVELIGKNMS